MEKERKKEKKLSFLAAAYYDHVKAFSKDSRSFSRHVSTVIVTRFVCQKHCAWKNRLNVLMDVMCFLQVSTLSWLFDCMFCRNLGTWWLLSPEALMQS